MSLEQNSVEVLASQALNSAKSPIDYYRAYSPPQPMNWPSFALAVAFFALTAVTMLAAGAQLAAAYAAGHAPDFESFFPGFFLPFSQPRLFLSGVPFAATLLSILLAHELGHYFMCRYYRIYASYPFFLPAPTLIGTFGAFIRIRSQIFNRRALFDMAVAGPLAGFLLALPALAVAIAHSKIVPASMAAPFEFGRPLAQRLLEAWLRPGVPSSALLLNPMGRAAWVGLFATALNLLPAGQLDGGHILYTLTARRHRAISLGVAAILLPLAFLWPGWILWVVVLVALAFRRHPPLIDPWEPLDGNRRVMAAMALLVFLLCFMPAPFSL